MLIENGWLSKARHCCSPNYDARPAGVSLSLLVVHNISLPPENFDTGCIEKFFCNELDPKQHPYFESISGLKVSSHFLIDRAGELIQFVSINDRAWHAGVSNYQGIQRCNDYSIGIELEGTDLIPYTQLQYRSLAKLLAGLIQSEKSLSENRIVGHSDIAPGRKTDPGDAFEWPYFRKILAELMASR